MRVPINRQMLFAQHEGQHSFTRLLQIKAVLGQHVGCICDNGVGVMHRFQALEDVIMMNPQTCADESGSNHESQKPQLIDCARL